jgi:hypothetical protein
MLKLIILINFVLLVISLFSGLIFVYKDKGEGNRVFKTLVTRVGLALSLMALITYGIYSGQIGSHAPWDVRLNKQDLEALQQAQKEQAQQQKAAETTAASEESTTADNTTASDGVEKTQP